ncbi:N-acetylmuramoyl-L-alanine amidase [Stomatohabitans albus]|uniref:N-acetylmuramoyl-L-alanine amidase n=1 Tax=Stomatohabitans albus TaxID=3110766 RepID=UPI00300D4E69
MGLPLRYGDVGAEVFDLRRRLSKWSEDTPTVGVPLAYGEEFDDNTVLAVKTFQQARGLTPSGVVDSDTWESLVEADFHLGDRLLWYSTPPMRGDDVLDLQSRLNQLGFEAGREDGLFSHLLDNALREFQDHMGIEVDGVAGPRTLVQLKRLRRAHMEIGASARVRDQEQFEHAARAGLPGMVVLIDPASIKYAQLDHRVLTDWSWSMATQLHARLSAVGMSPVLSRGPLNDPSNADRAALANRIGAKLTISLSLAAHDDPNHVGAHAYYFASPSHQSSFTSPVGQDLAYAAMQAVRAIEPGVATEVAPRTWTMLRGTRMPTVIIEPAYGTNPESLATWSTPEVQTAFANRMVNAIASLVQRYTKQD